MHCDSAVSCTPHSAVHHSRLPFVSFALIRQKLFFRDLHRFENDEESIFNGTDLLYSIEHSTVCVAGK